MMDMNKKLFGKLVIIKTRYSEYKTRIAGEIKDYIITLDNDIIFKEDILCIKVLD